MATSNIQTPWRGMKPAAVLLWRLECVNSSTNTFKFYEAWAAPQAHRANFAWYSVYGRIASNPRIDTRDGGFMETQALRNAKIKKGYSTVFDLEFESKRKLMDGAGPDPRPASPVLIDVSTIWLPPRSEAPMQFSDW